MAFAKRRHDVISVDSDTSDQDSIVVPRPLKHARRREMYLEQAATNYQHLNLLDLDDIQHIEYAGPSVNRQLGESPAADQGAYHLPHATQTAENSGYGTIDDAPMMHYDLEWFADAHESPIIIEDSPSPPPQLSLLDQVLAIVPDIAHDHVIALLDLHQQNISFVLEQILSDNKYPREADKRAAEKAAEEEALKAKKAADDAELQALLNPPYGRSTKTRDTIIEILKDEFNTIPIKFIRDTVKTELYLYPAYLVLNEAKHAEVCPYGKTPWRNVRDVDFDVMKILKNDNAINIALLEEHFKAARKAAEENNIQRRKKTAKERREALDLAAHEFEKEQNLERARASGRVADCAACFDQTPLNRMVQCNSADSHFVCYDCMKTYLASEIGQSRCKLDCPGGCEETFREAQLRLVPGSDALVDELMRLQQEQSLRTAGIEDIESCPFCDFKKECLPIDVDFEFHCQNSACMTISCRKCREKTHVPETCEESAQKRSKDTALSHRHKIEEARSKALIRNCNKCKRPFIKEAGCNKMTCPNCNNLQCYICGENVTANYAHFQPPNPCPTFDDGLTVQQRHEQEVNAASELTRAQVLRDNPDIDAEHLNINFADAVQAAQPVNRRVVIRPRAPVEPGREGERIHEMIMERRALLAARQADYQHIRRNPAAARHIAAPVQDRHADGPLQQLQHMNLVIARHIPQLAPLPRPLNFQDIAQADRPVLPAVNVPAPEPANNGGRVGVFQPEVVPNEPGTWDDYFRQAAVDELYPRPAIGIWPDARPVPGLDFENYLLAEQLGMERPQRNRHFNLPLNPHDYDPGFNFDNY